MRIEPVSGKGIILSNCQFSPVQHTVHFGLIEPKLTPVKTEKLKTKTLTGKVTKNELPHLGMEAWSIKGVLGTQNSCVKVGEKMGFTQ